MRAAPELLSAMLSEVGVELKIVPTEFPAKWIEDVPQQGLRHDDRRAHGAARHRHLRARQLLLQLQERQAEGRHRRSGKTVDEKARFAKYAEAQKILAEDVPALFLFQLPKLGSGTRS